MAADAPLLPASNRGYRYGDGLFETMKIVNGQIAFKGDHFERLFSGLELLKFSIPSLFTKEKLEVQVLDLCRRNNCEELARVRLSVSRGNGGLYDENGALQWIIESFPLSKTIQTFNENGLVIGIYPEAPKSMDRFSNLKSANFLIYSMAAIYAKENKLNDCLVLNTEGKLADSTIANVFIIKGDRILTTGLDQGCIAGVFRKNLLSWLGQNGYSVEESALTVADLGNADEVFLTNAIRGIQWVGDFRDKKYGNVSTRKIYEGFRATIPH